MGYEFLEHTADVKFRASGSTKEELFGFCVDALNDTIRGDIKILEQVEREIVVEGRDLEELLYSFLEEFLVLLDSEGFLVSSVRGFVIEGMSLKCIAMGDDAENYKFTNDVKAVTYSEMVVRKEVSGLGGGGLESGVDRKWVAEVVLDV